MTVNIKTTNIFTTTTSTSWRGGGGGVGEDYQNWTLKENKNGIITFDQQTVTDIYLDIQRQASLEDVTLERNKLDPILKSDALSVVYLFEGNWKTNKQTNKQTNVEWTRKTEMRQNPCQQTSHAEL